MKEYKNYIFDLGGVVVNIDMDRVYKGLHDLGIDNQSAEELRIICDQYQLGQISSDAFCHEVCSLAKGNATPEQVRDIWVSVDQGVDLSKLETISRLHLDHNVFLLSNTNELHWLQILNHDFIANGYKQDDLFHRVFLSQEMGLAKPGREIFLHVLSEAGISAEETLFIDDTKENIDAAKSCGIDAILVEKNSPWPKNLF